MNGEEGVEHVLVTSGAGPVVGKLIRWVWNDGEVGYETRINGLEDHGGVCDVAAFSVDMIRSDRVRCERSPLRVVLPPWRTLNPVDVQLRVEVAE
jgi:hypothetical protein